VYARTAFMVSIGTSFAQTSLPKKGDKREITFIKVNYTQINTQNAILHKNQCKRNNQITFKTIRDLNFTQILRIIKNL